MQMSILKGSIRDINNSSTNGNGYSDFTAVTTNLTIELKTLLQLRQLGQGQTYSEAYVWIDLNGDSDFEDVGELVWSKALLKQHQFRIITTQNAITYQLSSPV
jgi:hypothetical protein